MMFGCYKSENKAVNTEIGNYKLSLNYLATNLTLLFIHKMILSKLLIMALFEFLQNYVSIKQRWGEMA